MSSIHSGTSTFVVILQALCRQPYCWDFIGAASLACQEDTLLQLASAPLASTIFPAFHFGGKESTPLRPYANGFALGVILQQYGRSHLLRELVLQGSLSAFTRPLSPPSFLLCDGFCSVANGRIASCGYRVQIRQRQGEGGWGERRAPQPAFLVPWYLPSLSS